MVVDALGLVSVQHQGNVVVLMFLPGTFSDCDIRRVISCPFTVLDEALLKTAECFIIIRIIVIFRKPDIISHEEDLAVTVAQVSHDLLDLLQYRLLTSEPFLFVGYDGMSLILFIVSDSFASHDAVLSCYYSSLVTVYSVLFV